MNKRKVSWFNILISFVVVVVAGLLIYVLINRATQKYTAIGPEQGIQLIIDKSDEYKITTCSVQINGNKATVSMELKNTETNKNSFYTFEMYAGEWYEEKTTIPAEGTDAVKATLAELVKLDTTKYPGVSVYTESTIMSWLPSIISTVITIIIFIFLFRMLMASAGSNQQAMNFNKSRARRADDSKVRFDDVAGCDEEKAEMVELVEYLKNPKKFTKFGAKLPKGVLLVGPPGTGKTLLAKAVAGEAGVPFYSISGSDFVEMFVGVGAGRVRDLFKTAKQNAPCLVFIDEIDAVGRQRGAGLGGGNDEREQTLNQLLVELDGFEENSGIIVIAATNRDDVLDPALLRAGRFDRQITVNLPDKEGREAIFKVHAKNKNIDPNVDFGLLAKRTVGFSGADIANILNEAAILAVRANRERITTEDIDEAIDRNLSGPAKSNKNFSEKDKKTTAYHEAGHAIIGLELPDAEKVRKITIIPRGRALGYTLFTPDQDKINYTKSELLAMICGLLGGRSAEEVFFNEVSTGASNDIERATGIARRMVVEFGMSSLGPIQYEQNSGSVFLGRDYTNTQKNFSLAVANEIDKEIRKLIEEAHAQAIEIIKRRKDDVILIAETLLENETINEEQIDYLLKNRCLPSKKVEEVKEEEKPAENSENPQKSTNFLKNDL